MFDLWWFTNIRYQQSYLAWGLPKNIKIGKVKTDVSSTEGWSLYYQNIYCLEV